MLPAREERVEGVELGTVADVASSVRELSFNVEAAHRGRAGRGLGVACEGGKDVMVGTHVKLLYSDIHRMIRHLQNAIHNLTYEKAFSAKCKSHRPDLVMWSVCFFEVY